MIASPAGTSVLPGLSPARPVFERLGAVLAHISDMTRSPYEVPLRDHQVAKCLYRTRDGQLAIFAADED